MKKTFLLATILVTMNCLASSNDYYVWHCYKNGRCVYIHRDDHERLVSKEIEEYLKRDMICKEETGHQCEGEEDQRVRRLYN